jgi:zinc/manganese transport system permease protein
MNLATATGILWPALLAGLLVIATHVPLGQEVLKRGIVFIDLAIAQVAVLGVITAEVLGFEAHGIAVQLIAVGAALGGAALLAFAERRLKTQQEALIGALFVLAASAALLVLHGHPHGAEHLKDVLEGQILWTDPAALAPVALLYGAVLALWFGARARLGRTGFYLLFALTVTASVQLVGVYLVFASLILPALAVSRFPPARRLPLAWALGAAAYGGGLARSLAADLPAAPVIVCLLALVGGALLAWTTVRRA